MTRMVYMEDTDKVFAFAYKIKISAYLVTRGGFVFSTILFLGEIRIYLNVLLSFVSSIHNALTSDGRNINHIKMHVSVLVSVCTLTSVLIGVRYEFKGYIEIYRYFVMTVSVFSVNVVAVMLINLAVLPKGCFVRINTCLCELIQCTGEESVALYRQIPTVKHPQPLIELNTFVVDQRRSSEERL